MSITVENTDHYLLPPETKPAILQALAMLLQAYNYASLLERNTWEFAVEIQLFCSTGVTYNELRWLQCKKYVEQAAERISHNGHLRVFEPSPNLSFTKRTCFVLTPAGIQLARSLLRGTERTQDRICTDHPSIWNRAALGCIPVWDKERQTLRLNGSIVKRFKTPALNQEAILTAFEEEGWPPRIDDPIPPQFSQEPKIRLHNTINALNRNQKHPLIRFLGDGSGQGVRWELIEALSAEQATGNMASSLLTVTQTSSLGPTRP